MLKSFKEIIAETAPRVVKTKSGHWQVLVHRGSKNGYVPHGELHDSKNKANRVAWQQHQPRSSDAIMAKEERSVNVVGSPMMDQVGARNVEPYPTDKKIKKKKKRLYPYPGSTKIRASAYSISKEETEQIDEIGFVGALGRTFGRSVKDLWRNKHDANKLNKVDHTFRRRMDHITSKARKRYNPRTEETEQIDEIGDTETGRTVLGQYRNKARKDMFSQRDMADDAYIANQHDRADKHDNRADKRMHGLMVSKNRLGKKTPNWLSKRLGKKK